jgi:hypothetical protein
MPGPAPIRVPVEDRVSRDDAGSLSNAGSTELPLAGTVPPQGFLKKRGRRLRELVHRHPVTAGTLVVTPEAIVVDARAVLRGRWEIPWTSVRKVLVDDGERWGYVASLCRFPVYDTHADGSGSGTLIGPLWSHAASLMPPRCPQLAFDPVPVEAPNVALILDPCPPAPSRRNDGAHGQDRPVALVLLRANNPLAARQALASRAESGDIDHDDLLYLARAGDGSNGNGLAENDLAPPQLSQLSSANGVVESSSDGSPDPASSSR